MRYSSKTLPERVRRLVPKETRVELKAPTSAEVSEKQNTKREKELQENIANLLRQRGIWFFRQRMDRRTTGTVGWPDFTFAVFGRPVVFECKLPGRRLTKEQDECLNRLMANGWRFAVIESEVEAVAVLNQLEGKD